MIRHLKIEQFEEPRRGLGSKPRRSVKIRLKGDWLEKAGFHAGQRVAVQFIESGLLQLKVNNHENKENDGGSAGGSARHDAAA